MNGGGYLAEGSLFAGRYRIARELGRGGVSVVYAARDLQVEQDVALKLLLPSPATANQTRERMRREVNAVRRLTHPNIVAVYDFVEDGQYGAVIMELVDDEDLDRRIRRLGALSPDDVATIGSEVGAAVSRIAGRLPDRPSPHLPLPPSASGYTPIAVHGDVPLWLAHIVARATACDPASLDESLALFDREARRDEGDAAGVDSLAVRACSRSRGAANARRGDGARPAGHAIDRGIEDGSVCLGVAEIASEVRARTAARDELTTLLTR